jgi:hypothetical protein
MMDSMYYDLSDYVGQHVVRPVALCWTACSMICRIMLDSMYYDLSHYVGQHVV